jgi:hypothetical protein
MVSYILLSRNKPNLKIYFFPGMGYLFFRISLLLRNLRPGLDKILIDYKLKNSD